jgi:quercetin dioxygenase-like cupin family protein
VHVVLRGELVIEDDGGRRTYRPGDRVEFPANTTHTAGTIGGDGEMIVGVKP